MKYQTIRNIVSDASYLIGHFFYWLLFLADIALVILISPWGSGMDQFTEWGSEAFSAWKHYASKEAYYMHFFKYMALFLVVLVVADILYRKKHKIWAFVVLLLPFLWAFCVPMILS